MAEGFYSPSVSRKVHFLPDASPSLQRVLLAIQPYDFEIKYIPGKEVALPDAVSRVNPQDEMELKGLNFTTQMNLMHDTNTDVNDMC